MKRIYSSKRNFFVFSLNPAKNTSVFQPGSSTNCLQDDFSVSGPASHAISGSNQPLSVQTYNHSIPVNQVHPCKADLKIQSIGEKPVFITQKQNSMKTRVLLSRFFNPQLMLLFVVLLVSFAVCAQTPQLVFRNPTLIKGTAKKDGAEYRFSNVTSGVDAILEIKGRSSDQVVIKNLDNTESGWDKAFQPEVGIATVGAYQNWWIEFQIEFVEAGTEKKKKLEKFVVTGLDIDGDNSTLSEWVEMKKIKKVTFSQINYLKDNILATVTDLADLNNNGEDHRIDGPTKTFGAIDTLGTAVMATYEYENKDKIEFKVGGKTGSRGSSAGSRLNSLWFKSFNLSPYSILPIKIADFAAKYEKPNVTLTWSSSQEENFSHFVIERSTDGNIYNEAGIVFGQGNSSNLTQYNYIDKNMSGSGGLVYYRLKLVDADKYITYSAVRIVRIGDEKPGINISAYPNPVTNELKVTIPSAWQNKHVKIEVFNNNGIKVKDILKQYASQTESIPVADLGKGFYVIRASFSNEAAQQKFLKN